MNPWKGKKVAVVMGGISHEKEVSVRTGTGIAAALKERGYTVTPMIVGDDAVQQIMAMLPDVVFIALHGRFGEDGAIQGALEMLHIPYTGSDVCASAVAMNKILTKRIAETVGVKCPGQVVVGPVTGGHPVRGQSGVPAGLSAQGKPPVPPTTSLEGVRFPAIVKPNREGSTVGMHIVRNEKELAAALKEAATLDSTVMVEEFIEGCEVTVGVLCGEALPVLEIVPKSGFYDYAAKYTKGMTDYICPARIDATVAATVQTWARQVHELLGCRGVTRSDFMISKAGAPYFLEINTIPGMTETSLVPKAAAQMGLSYADVCERMLADAHCEAVK